MVNLRTRSVEPEIMDDFDLPSEEIDPVLAGLGQMNAVFGGHKSLIKALWEFPVQNNYSISDWGCGGGDAVIAIAKHAQKDNINLKFTGIDAAPAAVNFATEQSANYSNIKYEQANVLLDDFGHNRFDIIISSLFTHHFADEEWVSLIRKMNYTAKRGVIITDLHRHWFLYYAILVITRLFTNNKMAQYDGPLSVRRSFKKSEIKMLLAKAGITNYKLKWMWAFRWQIVIYKS